MAASKPTSRCYLKTFITDCSSSTDSVGFEPTEPFGSSDFKSDALDHSANYPNVQIPQNGQTCDSLTVKELGGRVETTPFDNYTFVAL